MAAVFQTCSGICTPRWRYWRSSAEEGGTVTVVSDLILASLASPNRPWSAERQLSKLPRRAISLLTIAVERVSVHTPAARCILGEKKSVSAIESATY